MNFELMIENKNNRKIMNDAHQDINVPYVAYGVKSNKKLFEILNNIASQSDDNLNLLTFACAMYPLSELTEKEYSDLKQYFSDVFQNKEISSFCDRFLDTMKSLQNILGKVEYPESCLHIIYHSKMSDVFKKYRKELMSLFAEMYSLYQNPVAEKYCIEAIPYFLVWLSVFDVSMFIITVMPKNNKHTLREVAEKSESIRERLSPSFVDSFQNSSDIAESKFEIINNEVQFSSANEEMLAPFVGFSKAPFLHFLCYPFERNTIQSVMQSSSPYLSALICENRLTEKLLISQKDKANIINDFSHTYANMKATTLQEIAKDLLSIKHELFIKWGRKLLVEYSIKENLTKTVELLKLQFEDRTQEVIEKIRGTVGNGRNTTDIKGLVSAALKRCFMSLLYDESNSNNVKCKLFFGTENYDNEKEKLRENFEEHILMGTDEILLWLKKTNTIDLVLSISGEWKNLNFQKGEYAALILTGWISELFINIFKYADKKRAISIDFSQKKNLLFINVHNYCDSAAKELHGSQNGINAMRRTIQRLNSEVGYNENPLNIHQSDLSYQLEMQIASEILSERRMQDV